MSYAKMAQVYDVLMADAPYDRWQDFASYIFKLEGMNGNKIADLGCGTGQITRRLAKLGYDIIGIDNSVDMLTNAQHQALAENLTIQWFQQDIRELSDFSDYDAVISFCDVINYITEEKDVKKVFQNANQMLHLHGLFLFDVHSIKHIEEFMKEETFAEVYDDISYVWFCEPGKETGEVFHDLTFFVSDTGHDKYERFDERHHQRTYSIEEYNDWLTSSGFEKRGIYADFSTNSEDPLDNADRLFFVYEKIRDL